MKIDLQRADVGSRIILGMAGFALSAVLAWGELGTRSRDVESKQIEITNSKVDSLTREFQFYYQLARSAKPKDTAAYYDLDLAASIAQTLAESPYNMGSYNESVMALRTQLDSANGKQSTGIETPLPRILSSELGAGEANGTGDWFVVLESYSATDIGRRLALSRAYAISTKYSCAEVWSAGSDLYVVVLQGQTDSKYAAGRAESAKRLGVSPVAYARLVAGTRWTKIRGCK